MGVDLRDCAREESAFKSRDVVIRRLPARLDELAQSRNFYSRKCFRTQVQVATDKTFRDCVNSRLPSLPPSLFLSVCLSLTLYSTLSLSLSLYTCIFLKVCQRVRHLQPGEIEEGKSLRNSARFYVAKLLRSTERPKSTVQDTILCARLSKRRYPAIIA